MPVAAEIGCTKEDLDTPALCVDLEALESNIASMASRCQKMGKDWRPHAKSHKSAEVGRKLIEAGAMGLTCAKLGEAEVMAAAGIRDLLIANLIVGPRKVERLVNLRRIADPVVCVDHIEQARPLSDAMQAAGLRLRVIIEVDIGMGRVGVLPGPPTLELARQLLPLPGLQFSGIMGYEGHLLQIQQLDEKDRRISEALDLLGETRASLEKAGIPVAIVSCGGSGSFEFCTKHPAVTEVQAGGAIFMDEFYRNRCQVAGLEQALTIVATVVGRPAPDRAIIDAGRKTMNLELQMPRPLHLTDVEVVGLSAEHGILRLGPGAKDLKIGERIELIPGYGDFTTVLHDQFHAFRQGRLESIWPLTARGCLQ